MKRCYRYQPSSRPEHRDANPLPFGIFNRTCAVMSQIFSGLLRVNGRFPYFALSVLLLGVFCRGACAAQRDQGTLQALSSAAGDRLFNVRSFGASANNSVINVVSKTGSPELTVRSTPGGGGFAASQSVVVLHAGALPTVGPPAELSIQPLTYRPNGEVTLPRCQVDRRNPSCDARWTWRVIAVDSLGGSSAPSAPAMAEKAPAQPNPTNRIELIWRSDLHAEGYLLYGCQGSNCTPTLRAVVPNNWYTSKSAEPCQGCRAPSFMVFDYIGHDFGIDEVAGNAMPRSARNEMLLARILSISRDVVQLSVPARVNIATRMLHDDSVAFQAALDEAKRTNGTTGSNGGLLLVPPGQYPIARTLDLYRSSNIRFFGLGPEGKLNQTQLIWHGGPAGKVFNLNQARDLILENFAVTDNNGGSTPGVILDIDKYDRGEGIKTVTTHDTFRNLSLQRSGVAVRIGNRGHENCEMMRFDNVLIDSPWNNQGGWYGYYIAGGGQTYDERIDGGSVGFRDAAFFINAAGSIDAYGLNLAHNFIDWYINRISFDHIIEIGSDSEWAATHLYVAFPNSNIFRMAIYDSRLLTLPERLASNNYYIVDNTSLGLRLVSNHIRQAVFAPCKVMVSAGPAAPNAPLISMQNMYGDPHPFVAPPGVHMALLSFDDVACMDAICNKGPISPPMNPDVANVLSALADLPIRGAASARSH